ncbi:EAL domain-containing protein [Shimia sp. SDUM112013]|uniref:EAL domain-containing protein n=1 Tax=Shimia sp. SDUM112013 TaxID=3136160 RepID=UPI0032EB68ED
MRRKRKDRFAHVPEGQTSPLDSAVHARDGTTMDMVRAAIAHKQVRLAYQPVVSAQNPTKPVFYEGLIRVLDETGRIIPAKDFMGAVAHTDLGRQLDCLALELGMHALGTQPTLRLSINMSGRSIGYSRWMTSFRRALKRWPGIADRLILEISESSLNHVPEIVADFMEDLQLQGVSFALDDYGAEMTSFRVFKDFFFDILKLDGQFTKNIQADAENQIIARSIAYLGGQFDIYTVASRVETPKDAEVLRDLGFDCLQGFLFGAPSISPPWDKTKKNRNAA